MLKEAKNEDLEALPELYTQFEKRGYCLSIGKLALVQ